MNRFSNISAMDILMMLLAILAGNIVIYLGDRFLNVSLEVFYGISTFNPIWVLSLMFVPFVAGIVVSLIYGLGGKMLAHFAPIPVRIYQYMHMQAQDLPDGVTLLPVGYWILLLIICVEAAAVGGFVGEVMIKRTYGRRPKHLIHKRYQIKQVDESES